MPGGGLSGKGPLSCGLFPSGIQDAPPQYTSPFEPAAAGSALISLSLIRSPCERNRVLHFGGESFPTAASEYRLHHARPWPAFGKLPLTRTGSNFNPGFASPESAPQEQPAQPNNWLAFTPCARATCDTGAAGASVSSDDTKFPGSAAPLPPAARPRPLCPCLRERRDLAGKVPSPIEAATYRCVHFVRMALTSHL